MAQCNISCVVNYLKLYRLIVKPGKGQMTYFYYISNLDSVVYQYTDIIPIRTNDL